MSQPINILSAGMISGVGLTADASCAAIRSAIDGFVETGFLDTAGKPIMGAAVPLDPPLRGADKLVHFCHEAIRQVLDAHPNLDTAKVPLMVCLSEPSRPGRFTNLEESVLAKIESSLELRFHSESRVIAQGRMSGVLALQLARGAIQRSGYSHCLIVGADTYLVGATLAAFEERRRLLTSKNTDGFLPGEGAAAVLLGNPEPGDPGPFLQLLGMGSGTERATIESGEPLRADGMVTAVQAAMAESGIGYEDLDYRLTDINGEQYFFREAALSLTRTMRTRKDEFDIWHPADCIGETGAAAVPILLTAALAAARKQYAPGPGILCHLSCDGPERAALILRQSDS